VQYSNAIELIRASAECQSKHEHDPYFDLVRGVGMNVFEMLRIIAITLLGAIVMFFLQPWLYQSQILFLGDVTPENWIADEYMPGAYLVAAVSILGTLLWYFLSARAKILTSQDTSRWRLFWWLICLLPLLSIGGALSFFNTSRDALLTLAVLYVIDVLLLFWLTTATSSPAPTKFLPPGAFVLRRLVEPG